jgi:hypothetical protein
MTAIAGTMNLAVAPAAPTSSRRALQPLAEIAGHSLWLQAPGVPDALWPSDNIWDVPALPLECQADALDLPVWGWGSRGRRSWQGGTVHFYTADERFNALWRNPAPVVNAGVVSAVEPNFSIFVQMPRAVALHQVYRKRWLSRWWAGHGIRIFVDLNVPPEHQDLNLLGVPHGWRAWATRGCTARLDEMLFEHDIACQRAGTSAILFLVVGGGRQVRELCMTRCWAWIAEQRDVAKGKFGGGIYGK